ncbi:hypothetical protein BV898_11249 [Hypsibius exemplaris]|uniref:G-protein coupled receptors family 1 profile domain-containing protein n=1 Tax=Hypsibius exemplaris TaxID=2072580 RepID=A0A1W0WH47_HYPEX|nr:hypothetical protein BV898_11249 [Hypsibius exemplaris]
MDFYNDSSSVIISVTNATGYNTAVRITLASLTLLLLITSAIANLLIIIAFLRFRKLRTNFNFYLLNVSISDILLAIFSMSNFAIFMLYGEYPFGYGGCTFWLYCDWLFSAATENTMMLISLDRVFSVYWPIHYRNWQTTKYSLTVLAVMWVWLNANVVPCLVLGRLAIDVTDSNTMCLIDYTEHRDLITTSVILLFWLPEAVTVISYVFIAVKMRQKFDASSSLTKQSSRNMKNGVGNYEEGLELARPLAVEADREPSPDEASLTASLRRVDGVNGNGKSDDRDRRKSREQRERKTFQLLSYLVIAVLICCVPADVYHFIAATRPQWATYGFYQLSSFFTFLHCILNPILYHAGLEDMKKAIHRLFANRWRTRASANASPHHTHGLSLFSFVELSKSSVLTSATLTLGEVAPSTATVNMMPYNYTFSSGPYPSYIRGTLALAVNPQGYVTVKGTLTGAPSDAPVQNLSYYNIKPSSQPNACTRVVDGTRNHLVYMRSDRSGTMNVDIVTTLRQIPINRMMVVGYSMACGEIIASSSMTATSAAPMGRPSTQLPSAVPKPTLPPALSAKSQKQLVLDLQKSFETHVAGPSDAINPVKYVQHNLGVGDGLAAFLPQVTGPVEVGSRVTVHRIFQDGNYVFAHTDYFFGGESSAAFDIYRFEDGLMAEHWDNVQTNPGPNQSGHTMLDGPTQAEDLSQTAVNKILVRSFMNEVLIRGCLENITDYFDGIKLLQHSPGQKDGLLSFYTSLSLAAMNNGPKYSRIALLLGEGSFVLAVSEGTKGGKPAAFYDLYRIKDGKIAEHWDVMETIPPRDEWKNSNGKF